MRRFLFISAGVLTLLLLGSGLELHDSWSAQEQAAL